VLKSNFNRLGNSEEDIGGGGDVDVGGGVLVYDEA
jgi:hypothetical protein